MLAACALTLLLQLTACTAATHHHNPKLAAHRPPVTPDDVATVMAASHVPTPAWTGQDREDEYAYTKFFYGVRGGSYLELGGHDGAHLSNTKALHDFYGWRGMLIEANPAEFPHLQRNRPFDVTVHAAVCSTQGAVHYLSHDVVGGIWEFMPATFKERWHPGADPATMPLVACLPLKSILAAHNATYFDLFSLDVEGAELEVLHSVDFGAVTFGVIVVEADEHNEAKNAAVRKLLAGHGYHLHERVLRNDWFVRGGFQASTKPT